MNINICFKFSSLRLGKALASLALVCTGFASLTVQAQQLKPISINYTISLVSQRYGNATLGKVQTTLRKTKQGYSVVSATKAQGLAAILMGSNIQESCDFVIEDGRAVSHSYSGGRNDIDDYRANYDWQQRKINFDNGESLDMPKGYVVDTCSLPFAAALLKGEGLSGQTAYVVDGKNKRIRGYKLKSSEPEVLNTNLGKINTIKVVLARELLAERTFTLWLSPKHSYVPLKMEERRDNRTTTIIVDQIDHK